MKPKLHINSVEDAQRLAKRRLPPSVYNMIVGPRNDGATARDNLRAFAEVGFRPRAAALHQKRELATTVLGQSIAFPVIIAPTGHVRMAHRDGELGAAKAAGMMGTAIGISTFSGYAIEDIAAATSGPVWYQLYYAGGRSGVEFGIERAKAAGCTALIITVDLAGTTYNRGAGEIPASINLRNMLRWAPEVLTRPRWLFDFMRDGMRLEVPNVRKSAQHAPMSMVEGMRSMFNLAFTWDDMAWIRQAWSGPIIVKGIMNGDDARRAIDAGANAIVVSNHGANALNGVPGTLRALPEVVRAANGRAEVLLDSGVRSGVDVVKALALGARAVLIGRAYIWGLAAGGTAGVERILRIFREDIDTTVALLGCSSIHELDASHLDLPAAWPARTTAF